MQYQLVIVVSAWITIFAWMTVVSYLIITSNGMTQLIHKLDFVQEQLRSQENEKNENKKSSEAPVLYPTIAPTTTGITIPVQIRGAAVESTGRRPVQSLLIVLGNEPLDDKTPTLDTMTRVKTAVSYFQEHPSSILIFTGGPTAGKTTGTRNK